MWAQITHIPCLLSLIGSVSIRCVGSPPLGAAPTRTRKTTSSAAARGIHRHSRFAPVHIFFFLAFMKTNIKTDNGADAVWIIGSDFNSNAVPCKDLITNWNILFFFFETAHKARVGPCCVTIFHFLIQNVHCAIQSNFAFKMFDAAENTITRNAPFAHESQSVFFTTQ